MNPNLHKRPQPKVVIISLILTVALLLIALTVLTREDRETYIESSGIEIENKAVPIKEHDTDVEVMNLRRAEEPRTGVIYRGAIRRVVDGDTLHIYFDEHSNYYQRTRMIGIDAPEVEGPTAETGDKATQHLVDLLEPHRSVFITLDHEHFDMYERLLIYVWETPEQALAADPHDGLINMKMVQDGYAESLPRTPNTSFAREFYDAEELAEGEKVGLWSEGDFTKSNRRTDPIPESDGALL